MKLTKEDIKKFGTVDEIKKLTEEEVYGGQQYDAGCVDSSDRVKSLLQKIYDRYIDDPNADPEFIAGAESVIFDIANELGIEIEESGRPGNENY